MLFQPGAPAALYLGGQLTHGILGDYAALSMRDGCFRCVEGGKKLRTDPLALLPQRKRLRHGIHFVLQPARLNGSLDKGFLVGSELDFHGFRVGSYGEGVKRMRWWP